jgi:hypothetical protein
MSQEIPAATINATGVYTNQARQQWEAWQIDATTRERKLVDTCSFEKGEEGRQELTRKLFKV